MKPEQREEELRYKGFARIVARWRENNYMPPPYKLVQKVRDRADQHGYEWPFVYRIREWADIAAKEGIIREEDTPAYWVRQELAKRKDKNEYMVVRELAKEMGIQENWFVEAFRDMISDKTKGAISASLIREEVEKGHITKREDIERFWERLQRTMRISDSVGISDVMQPCYNDTEFFYKLEERGLVF